jgi:hypothetical protein
MVVIPVVPSAKRRARKHHFCNTNALSLSSRHTSDEVVSDFGIVGMTETQYGHDDLYTMPAQFVSRHSTKGLGRKT